MDDKAQTEEQYLTAADIEDMESALGDIQKDVSEVKEDVDSLVATRDSSSTSSVDYSGQLAELGEVLVINDVLMLVLLLGVFLHAGLKFGGSVVRWLKHE